ncbi:hypothetical protein [Arthrobacter sp. B2a2-09]|uniref:hypothetical protein n=1 Tax=Arthrobacter sp. B2a2-09 TaxID=2952822 RepID=UPI0022CD7BF2|nr:hypothetical protein [Arthrobacter sp. B2a2-09]MCZ9884660.1 hypothetical protein [Arthrobacter sp. B2a2-09]
MSPADYLERAADEARVVTVAKYDGRIFTGTVHRHATDPDLFTIRSGGRGRPAVVHPLDVEEVIFE